VSVSDDPGVGEREDSTTEALDRARRHARSALAETLAAVHALLDAASLTISGEPSQTHRLLGPLAAILEGFAAGLDGGKGREAAALLRSLAAALDAEIARWETRAENDADARAVLRAFLGLRELLWEFGVRRESEPGDADEGLGDKSRRAGRASPKRRGGPRVQRVPVE
jgi:hypothetical protein